MSESPSLYYSLNTLSGDIRGARVQCDGHILLRGGHGGVHIHRDVHRDVHGDGRIHYGVHDGRDVHHGRDDRGVHGVRGDHDVRGDRIHVRDGHGDATDPAMDWPWPTRPDRGERGEQSAIIKT